MKRIVYAANPAPAQPSSGSAETTQLVVLENPSAKGKPNQAGKRTRTAGSRDRKPSKAKKTSKTSGKKQSSNSTSRDMATKKRSSSKSKRQNPAAAISSKAVSTAKEAGSIILGSAVADQGVALLNNKVLASQGMGVRSAAAVGVPGALGLALLSQNKKPFAQNVGLGMVITSVKNGIAVGLGAATATAEKVKARTMNGPGRSRSLGRASGCGCHGSGSRPRVARRLPMRTLPTPTYALQQRDPQDLPAGFTVS